MNTAEPITHTQDAHVATQDALPSKKELYRTTIRMAWPTMVESFLVSLTGFVDTIMVSSLGASAIAALGLTDQPKFLGLSTFWAIATAVSSICARRKGEHDRNSANLLVRKILIAGTILCLAITAALFMGADFIIHLAGSQPDTHQMAVNYFRIVSAGQILVTTTLIINAAQRGVGNTRISMLTNISANAVNVLFNYLLIGGHFGFPALGTNGAAIATVLGAGVGCAISIGSALNPRGFIYLGFKKQRESNPNDIPAALSIGSSALAEQIFLRIGFFLFAITVAKLGTMAFSAHIIGMKFLNLSFALADGLSIAGIALVGRSLGEKRPALAKAYCGTCRKLGVGCSIAVSLIFIFLGRQLYMIFTDVPEILAYSNTIFRLLCVITFLQVAQVITTACLRGAGDTKFTAFTSLISVAIVRPLASWALCYPLGLGLIGVWVGLMLDQVVRYLLSWLRFRQGKWLEIKV